jgi:hypothetical protein
MWFCYIYLISGYIKKHGIKHFDNKLFSGCMSVVTYFTIWGLIVLTYYLAGRYPIFSGTELSWARICCLPILLCSITIFYWIKNVDIGSKKIINAVSKTTFGVYLIHDNGNLREYLWKNIIKTPEYFYSGFFFIHLICTVIIIYIICVMIDFGRIYLIEKPLFASNILNKCCQKIDSKLEKFL